ncbi:hypothetical protein [Rhodopirellula baltica]|uniref:Uncharacterized protein n=1 Tax=Rhodopirellula baltica WH47 TaxID=991778 RepID=F2AWI0_RHOBT|nr:hypothetical protein [Rhodopirellula baltica]EGF25983.1 hypothetical protein RBWH47_04047 [Rhodopirellula baltica WH47]
MLKVEKQTTNETTQSGCKQPPPKFAVVIDDVPYSVPRPQVSVSVLKSQAAIPDADVLVRDHNSPHDVVMDDDQMVEVAMGNVFYTQSKCDLQPRDRCSSPAKMAFFVDDRFEITTNRNQSESSIKGLFGLPKEVALVRDLKSPNDQIILAGTAFAFEDGPVFITRRVEAALRITVNHRPFTEDDGVKDHMTGLAVAALVYPEDPRRTKVHLGDRTIGHDETIVIHGCEAFEVVRDDVKGGYEQQRIEREIQMLRDGGATVTIVPAPTPAIVYHNLRTRAGCDPPQTDVLVPIPSGYPSEIDWAYLPVASPLIGRVQGSPQNHRIEALGVTWQQISYHPHRGGGAPPFNPRKHGFHTYISEVLSWLYKV